MEFGQNLMTCKGIVVIAYPVQIVILNFSPPCCSRLIDIRHTVVTFLIGDDVESPERFVEDDATLSQVFSGSTIEME